MTRAIRSIIVISLLFSTSFAVGCHAEEKPKSAGEKPISERLKSFPETKPTPVTAQLVTEYESVQPNGKTRIGVLFTLEPGWHIYAKDPGDAGLPTTVDWFPPSGVTVNPLQYPPHEELLDPGNVRTNGYTTDTVLWSRLSAPNSGAAIPLQAKVTWLACNDVCIPGAARLEATLPVRSERPVPSAHAAKFPKLP